MSKEQSAFFELVRAGLWKSENREIRIDGTPDWDEVYRLAEEQSVMGLVAAGIDRFKVLETSGTSDQGRAQDSRFRPVYQRG